MAEIGGVRRTTYLAQSSSPGVENSAVTENNETWLISIDPTSSVGKYNLMRKNGETGVIKNGHEMASARQM